MIFMLIAGMTLLLCYHVILIVLQHALVHGVTLHALLDAGIEMATPIDGLHGVLLIHI
jgi:hypothetical protein